MVVHVHDEVLAHDSQPNQCNVCSEIKRSLIIYNVRI